MGALSLKKKSWGGTGRKVMSFGGMRPFVRIALISGGVKDEVKCTARGRATPNPQKIHT